MAPGLFLWKQHMASDSVRNTLPQVSQLDPWQSAWHTLTGNEFFAATLLGLAMLLLLAAWLPQAPAGDPAAYSLWLAMVQQRFGPASATLQTLGMFSIAETILLRSLVGLLGCVLILRLIDCAEQAWKNRKMADIASVAAVTGGLLLILGLALTLALGWRSRPILIGINESAPLGHATAFTLRLDSLQDNSGQVTLSQGTAPVATGLIAPGRVLHIAGLSVHLSSIGPAIRASATISDGRSLDLLASATASPANELVLRFTPDDPQRVFATSTGEVLVHVSFVQATQSFRVLVYHIRTLSTLFEGRLPPDGAIRTENEIFQLTPEKYASLIVAYNPGILPAVLGGILGALGLPGIALSRQRYRTNE
jgi:hypothetical protein